MKEISIAVTVGLTIKSLRLEKGISQENLASLCDLHRTYVGSIERAEKTASIVTLEKLTSALGITLSDFFKKCENLKSKRNGNK